MSESMNVTFDELDETALTKVQGGQVISPDQEIIGLHPGPIKMPRFAAYDRYVMQTVTAGVMATFFY